jgi:WD40 repeat protein
LGVSGADKSIRLYSLSRTGSLALTNELKGAHSKSIRSISFCPRRARLSAASFDGTVSIWTGITGPVNDTSSSSLKWSCTATLEGHENEVKSCAWGVFLDHQAEEEQVFLATCGRDKTVWIWAMTETADVSGQGEDDDFECLAVIQEHEQDIKCLAWHPSRPLFLTGSYDESVLAWGPLNPSLDDWIAVGKVAKDLNATVWTLSFSPDGKKLAIGLSNGKIILYELPVEWKSFDEWTRNFIEIFEPIAIEETESIDKGGCSDGEGCCSDEKSGGCCSNEADDNSKNLESEEEESGEGEGGCCGGGKNKKMQVDSCCNSKKPRTTPSLCIPPAEIYSLSWNSTSRFIALACSDHSLRIADIEKGGKVVEVVEGAHEGEINCVAWSSVEADVLASVGDDGRLKIWKIQ